MKKNIKRLSKKQFDSLLFKHKKEDRSVINSIEKIFVKRRKYILDLSKDSDVILLCSGGVDSVVTFNLLLEFFPFKVHPVFVQSGQKRNRFERESFEWYYRYFTQKYKNKVAEKFIVTYPSSAPEISQRLKGDLKSILHPEVLKKNYDYKTDTINIKRIFLYPAFIVFPGALSAIFFDLARNTNIRTIICSILPTDGEYNASQTFTSLRSTMLSLSTYTNDYSWQVLSLCIERELGLWLEKKDLIKFANSFNLPLDKTYSCLKGSYLNCGECLACYVRKKSFQESGVKDPTIYDNSTFKHYVNKKIETLRNILYSKNIVKIKDYY